MKNKVKDKGIFYPTGEMNQDSNRYQVEHYMEITVSYRFSSDLSGRLIFQVPGLKKKYQIINSHEKTNNINGHVGKPMWKTYEATKVAITTPRIASHLIVTNTLRRTSKAASSGV